MKLNEDDDLKTLTLSPELQQQTLMPNNTDSNGEFMPFFPGF